MAARTVAILVGVISSGCAPLAVMRPAGVLVGRERSAEIGGGLVELGPRPYVEEKWQRVGQIWATWAASRKIELTGVGFFDEKAAAGGVALRWTPIQARPFFGATEIEMGYAWGAVSLPFSLALDELFFIYAAPRIGNMGAYWTPGIPAGVSMELVDQFQLRAEVQFSWRDFDPYQRRTHLGVAGVYAW